MDRGMDLWWKWNMLEIEGHLLTRCACCSSSSASLVGEHLWMFSCSQTLPAEAIYYQRRQTHKCSEKYTNAHTCGTAYYPSLQSCALYPPGIAAQQMGDINESQNKRRQPVAHCVLMLTIHFPLWHPLTHHACHLPAVTLLFQIGVSSQFNVWICNVFVQVSFPPPKKTHNF